MKKMTLEQIVSSRFNKLVAQLDIPERYHEDLRQEIALAAIEYKRRNPTGNIGQNIDSVVTRWYMHELAHEDRHDFMESDEFSQRVEMKIRQEQRIKELQAKLDDFIRDFADTVHLPYEGTVSKSRKRYQIMINFIIEATGDGVDHVDVIKDLAMKENVTYESGRRVFASMIRRMKNPRYSIKLRDFLEAFEELRNLEEF